MYEWSDAFCGHMRCAFSLTSSRSLPTHGTIQLPLHSMQLLMELLRQENQQAVASAQCMGQHVVPQRQETVTREETSYHL